MALSAGKAAFKTKIESGKTLWVDAMIDAENSFLALYGLPPLSNTLDINGNIVITNNLDSATARLEEVFDGWADFMGETLFEAIRELFVNHGEVLPATLNVSGLPTTAPATMVSPGLVAGKGGIQ